MIQASAAGQAGPVRFPELPGVVQTTPLIQGSGRTRPLAWNPMKDLTEGPIAGHIVQMAVPMAVGMLIQTLTMFTVPVLYSMWKEGQLKWTQWFGDKNEETNEVSA